MALNRTAVMTKVGQNVSRDLGGVPNRFHLLPRQTTTGFLFTTPFTPLFRSRLDAQRSTSGDMAFRTLSLDQDIVQLPHFKQILPNPISS